MKKILGLDLGTTSIGWALVEEKANLQSKIIKLGVRVNPLTVDEKTNFEKGKPLSTNADRTLKRGARRNLQRFKLRRKNLIELLLEHKLITTKTPLTEVGKNTTHQTLELRAKSAKQEIPLEDFAKVLLAINKKRGYKSSRKAKNEEDGVAIDGMTVAKHLYDNTLTPGQYALTLLNEGKKHIPDFYHSDLQLEFDLVWNFQKQFYKSVLTDALYTELKDKGSNATWAICKTPFNIVGIKLEGKRDELKNKKYELRVQSLSEALNLEHLAIVLQEINNDKNKSSGYLGKVSDRSKTLYVDKKTVGEYLWEQIVENQHTSLKNQVFYRQDYLDEFEQIWETQAQFHKELTSELKDEIRDVVIFYQRKLKSQKGQISFCKFESWEENLTDEKGNVLTNKATGFPKKRTIGQRVIPKSSPLFQEYKIWQNINDLRFVSLNKEEEETYVLELEDKQRLFEELNLRGDLSEKAVLKFLNLSVKEWKTNQPALDSKKGTVKLVQGNRTNQTLFNIYQTIAENEGHGFDWAKKNALEINEELKATFPLLGIDASILDFDANLSGNDFDKQLSYQLWHLLYSAEDDHKTTEEDMLVYGKTDVNLKKKLHQKFGFKPEYATMFANAALQDDYGSLSARAIKKILPYMQDGNDYSEACALAGYNHSNSLTKEELDNRVLKDRLELLPKNSLRNPVVEKILNQMVNVINQVCDTYGKPDEIRIEMSRELKNSAKAREETTRFINAGTRANDEIRKTIMQDFGFTATKTDVIRYKLYKELESNGHKTLFTNQYVSYEKLYSKEIDIEHIIPKAIFYDDSFSNKTLAFRKVNLKKRDRTALDFIEQDYNAEMEKYTARVEALFKASAISKGKYKKLLTPEASLSIDFTNRDKVNTQYIAKKAKELLFEVFDEVTPIPSGRITAKLRSDWDLINVMKELNFPKYKALGLTEIQEHWDSGQEKKKAFEVIKDWTKRNDHRHHAMDALTVAFTTHNHIQYINNLNASRNKESKLYGVRNTITHLINTKNSNKKRVFILPMEHFRSEAKKHIEDILISFKTKNKVATRNINKTKIKKGNHTKIQLTPRGQLHKETVYGKSKRLMVKATKINKRFSLELANLIENKQIKKCVLNHLELFNNSPELAFDTKTLKKAPLLWKDEPLKEVICFEKIYTIRKDINPDNFKTEKLIDKIIDGKTRQVLKERLKEFENNPLKAFSDLEKNPIWINKEKYIAIKRVTITGVSNAEPLHYKKDHFGNFILNDEDEKQAVDFVSTGNNHHVAIYKDKNGKLQENVVSFYEAVARVNQQLPVIDKKFNSELGWEFLFTMKQNEMFVFPNDDFDISEIDLLDDKNESLISKHLFRVQSSSIKDYRFRHHLETTVTNDSEFAYKRIRSSGNLVGIIKVRINHIGKIVQVGEY